jgi:Protein of unknown function (DUF4236)
MSLRFFRRVRIAPGLRVNLSKSGASVSIGRRGAWYTVGPRGRRVTVGLPGTGLFWTEHATGSQAPPWFVRALAFLAIAACGAVFALVVWFLIFGVR